MGYQKRLRTQLKNAVSRGSDLYYFSGSRLGSGMRLSRERLLAKREENEAIPAAVTYTRQQRRRYDLDNRIDPTPAELARREMKWRRA